MATNGTTCKHCHTPVIRDLAGSWVHTSLAYVCRDRWGTHLDTYAEVAVRGVAPVRR